MDTIETTAAQAAAERALQGRTDLLGQPLAGTARAVAAGAAHLGRGATDVAWLHLLAPGEVDQTGLGSDQRAALEALRQLGTTPAECLDTAGMDELAVLVGYARACAELHPLRRALLSHRRIHDQHLPTWWALAQQVESRLPVGSWQPAVIAVDEDLAPRLTALLRP